MSEIGVQGFTCKELVLRLRSRLHDCRDLQGMQRASFALENRVHVCGCLKQAYKDIRDMQRAS